MLPATLSLDPHSALRLAYASTRRYYRDTTTSTNQKQLKSGTCTLTGRRPAVLEDALGWMDSNMAAACKATVRAETKRAGPKQMSQAAAKARQESGHGAEASSNSDGASDRCLAIAPDLSGSGRHRKAPERLDPVIAATCQRVGRRKSDSFSAASNQAAGLRMEKSRWKLERKQRERTRRLLLQELWKSIEQPEEGEGLVGWMVEALGVYRTDGTNDKDELATGTIVGYTPPDSYEVEWTDATQSTYRLRSTLP